MTGTQIEIIKKALYDVDTMEIIKLSVLPAVPFVASTKHNDKIQKLIDSERRRENSVLKLPFRNKVVIIIALFLILSLTLTACIFRKEIKEFIIKIYTSSIGFDSNTDKYDDNYTEHIFTYIPVEYKLIDSFDNVKNSKKVYSCDDKLLVIEQCSSKGDMVQLGSDDQTYNHRLIDKYNVYYTYTKNTYVLIWNYQEKIFIISCHESLGWDEIEKIILGVKVE